MIDEIDVKILTILQTDARIANAEIARRLDMAPSAILERIRKLEAKGVIAGYEARLNPEALGLGLMAFVFVRTDERVGEVSVGELLTRVPEVQEVHHIAGEDCYLARVRTKDTASLGRLLRETFGAIPSVRSTRTTVVLSTAKDMRGLPLDGLAKERTGD